MSFIYPRRVSFSRSNVNVTGVGGLPYSGETKANESAVPNIRTFPASIQQKRERSAPFEALPGDAPQRTGWQIFFKSNERDLVTERDIVTDDNGKRYQVVAAYWHALKGYRLTVELLEV